MSQMAILHRSRFLLSKPTAIRTIATFPFLSQEPELAEPTPNPNPAASPLPPNPASGSPLYGENWRNPNPRPSASSSTIAPLGYTGRTTLSESYDSLELQNLFGEYMASQKWDEVKDLFEAWVRSLDKNGKPNMPDVNLYNHYLRANLMIGASAAELLDILAQMDDFNVVPNTASFNLVLKSMRQAGETFAAEKLLERLDQGNRFALELMEAKYFRFLKIVGVGYKARAEAAGRLLLLKLGYSHEVELTVPPAVRVFCFKNNVVCCTGIDKQRVHQFAATVRNCKPPEVYKGKGIMYVDEVIKKKQGKKSK
ncbi:pentatricopeptide repeat-containing protein At1g26460, mitochondrial-like [Lotus japonicus]|nr:pentatricopeptide repeat-containing protein At1g26460, mitochondrial-like [Lotus japonicus]XP_057448509.1 pentatricopeptide repeat-containing protein At1g26460, mitochondrial-like [Lotus japonicus]